MKSENWIKNPDEDFLPNENHLVPSQFEYQKDLLIFILEKLKDAGLDPADDFFPMTPEQYVYDSSKDYYLRSVYLNGLVEMRYAFSLRNPLSRALVDKEAVIKFPLRLSAQHNSTELNNEITDFYHSKVDFPKLLTLLDDPSVDEVKRNMLIMILQILDPECIPVRDEVCVVPEVVGSGIDICANAEGFMLSFISGKYIKPKKDTDKKGYVTLIVDQEGKPIMLEKMHLGQSRSCVTLQPIRLGTKYIPEGFILESVPSDTVTQYKVPWPDGEGAFTYVQSVDDFIGFEPYRPSLFSIPPTDRKNAGASNFQHQANKAGTYGYTSYDYITPKIIRQFCAHKLQQSGFSFS